LTIAEEETVPTLPMRIQLYTFTQGEVSGTVVLGKKEALEKICADAAIASSLFGFHTDVAITTAMLQAPFLSRTHTHTLSLPSSLSLSLIPRSLQRVRPFYTYEMTTYTFKMRALKLSWTSPIT